MNPSSLRSFAYCWTLALACGCGQGSDDKPAAASVAPPPAANLSAAPSASTAKDVIGNAAILGACVDDEKKPYTCDEFYGDASSAVDKLKSGCDTINQHWVASCPTAERVGACKLGMKPYAAFELQWSYKGKPPNDSAEAVKKVCEKTQRGTFIEAM